MLRMSEQLQGQERQLASLSAKVDALASSLCLVQGQQRAAAAKLGETSGQLLGEETTNQQARPQLFAQFKLPESMLAKVLEYLPLSAWVAMDSAMCHRAAREHLWLPALKVLNMNGQDYSHEKAFKWMAKKKIRLPPKFVFSRQLSRSILDQFKLMSTLELSRVKEVEFEGYHSLHNIKHFNALTSIDMESRHFFNAHDMIHIQSLTTVRKLNLYNVTLPSSAFSIFESLTSIQDLSLGESGLRDNAIKHFKHLVQLKTLNIWDCPRLTDVGFSHLGKVTSLQHLELGSENVTDGGIAQLAVLSNLRFLSISNMYNITDNGLAPLCALKKLDTIHLAYLSDTMTGSGLKHLEKTPLKTVKLLGNFTKGGLESLHSIKTLQRIEYECEILGEEDFDEYEDKGIDVKYG